MYEAREGLAIAAGLAQQQERCAVGGQPRQLAPQLHDGAAAADRCRTDERSGADEFAARPARARIERALHRAQQLCERQWLLDKIVGAESCGLDRGLDGAVTG